MGNPLWILYMELSMGHHWTYWTSHVRTGSLVWGHNKWLGLIPHLHEDYVSRPNIFMKGHQLWLGLIPHLHQETTNSHNYILIHCWWRCEKLMNICSLLQKHHLKKKHWIVQSPVSILSWASRLPVLEPCLASSEMGIWWRYRICHGDMWLMSTPDETKPWLFPLGGYSSNSHFIWYFFMVPS